jgi:hypothetical protein
MKCTVDISPIIEEKLISLFGNDAGLDDLEIELSLANCPLWNGYRELFGVLPHAIPAPIAHEEFPIVDLLGSYFPAKNKIVIYLGNFNELEENFHFFDTGRFEYRFFLNVVLIHLIGHAICHRLKINGKGISMKKFISQGELYRIFVAQIITYHCLDEKEKAEFLKFSNHLKDEYRVFTHFVWDFTAGHNSLQDEISIGELKAFMAAARKEKNEISQLFISTHFDTFIHNRVLRRKPWVIEKIRPILTAGQLNDFGHLNKEHGFFIE